MSKDIEYFSQNQKFYSKYQEYCCNMLRNLRKSGLLNNPKVLDLVLGYVSNTLSTDAILNKIIIVTIHETLNSPQIDSEKKK